MLGVAMYITIKTLMEKNLNTSQIARATGHDWKTVKKVMKKIKSGEEYPEKQIRIKKLDNSKEQIIKWLEEGLSALRIHEKLLDKGIVTSYSTVKNFVSSIKKGSNVFMRIHTAPGEEAQVDFGFVGCTVDNMGKTRKTWVFNMKLSFSRYDYYEKVYDQRVETFIECHMNAFDFFKGVPKYVKIDNLKAAVLEASFYEPIYQEVYKQFAKHYNFKPLPCRVYTPNDKGKVESGIKYVKNNFFAGRSFQNSDDLDRQLARWTNGTCNLRTHGTTRKIPKEEFESEEKKMLRPLPKSEFNISKVGTRKVQIDCHIFVEYNYYSVPFEYVGKEVEIDLSNKLLKVIYQHKEITVHPRLSGRGKFSTIKEHYPKYKTKSASQMKNEYQAKMAEIGQFTEKIFFRIKDKQPNHWYKTVKGILSLAHKYSPETVELSCKRALVYNVYEYQRIKNICYSGAYNLPIDFQEEIYE